MYMKTHILAALREEFEQWEALLARLSEAQITALLRPGELSIKDEIAHLWAWQQRTISRMEGGLLDRAPDLPQWLPGVDPEDEESTDRINAWIYKIHRDLPWAEVHRNWRAGFQRLLELAAAISERELLDADRHPWLGGYSLAFILVASYDHHQEHLEKLLTRLEVDQ
jgi:hypothetical protein